VCSTNGVQNTQNDKDFTLTSIEGEEITLSKLKGRVVLIDFWATWCPPCRNSIPLFSKLYNEYHDQGFSVLGISSEEKAVLIQYRDEHRVPYPILLGTKEVFRMYGVSAIPKIIILDKKGVVRKTQVGFAPELEQGFTALINSLLRE
jgi:peroxiredoxin